MKKLIVILASVFLANLAFSQDVLYFTNGEKEEVVVKEIGTSVIKYQKYDNLEGPIYSSPKREIIVIVYESGKYEYPNVRPEIAAQNRQESLAKDAEDVGEYVSKEPVQEPFNQNFLSVNVMNFVHGNVNFSYERVLKSGKIGFRIPVKIGFDNENIDNYIFPQMVDQKVIGSVELGLMYYPFGQKLITYFNGVGVEGGASNRFDLISSTLLPNGGYEEVYDIDMESYLGVLFYNGAMINATQNFGMSFLLGIGPKTFPSESRNSEFHLNLSFNMGYKF